MNDFEGMYAKLNDKQQLAVDTIDGPLLVIAGPGTGKTQLLSARVANILKSTDTLPQNILCLTFTDAAALNMRERLGSMIGEAAYDVHIATYHSFGSDIIRTYPDYFTSINLETGDDARLERPIDDLTKIQIVSEIIGALSYDDPLKSARYFIKSVTSTISELKKSLISPDMLRALAKDNLSAVNEVSPKINIALGTLNLRKFDSAMSCFTEVATALTGFSQDLVKKAALELAESLKQAEETHKTSTLTAWKNTWLSKDENGNWLFTSYDQHRKIQSLARVYEHYQKKLSQQALYDFDDMILKTIEVLENKPELRNNVQEAYQFILLDEFQDTNAAQFEMVRLIADHPVHEGKPNIMAVGDDDQAIYAFQGAEVSNMIKFTEVFNDVKLINLDKNYRSHEHILHVAHEIGAQIETRLHEQLQNVSKDLEAAQTQLPKEASIERHEFKAQASEYSWVGHKISQLIKSGIKPEEIAVLAPKHRQLEEVVPFLNHNDIPVTYEKRENILEAPIIQQLHLLVQCVVAGSEQNMALLNMLLPQVLSLKFWQNPVEIIWKVNWQYAKFDETRPWAEIALAEPQLKEQVLFLLAVSSQVNQLPLEYALDILTGATHINLNSDEIYTSPMKDYYFSEDSQSKLEYFESISHLSVIRSHLRNYQQGEDAILKLKDFLVFFSLYSEAEQPLINSHPIAQDTSSVQLMTVYKAKGLEFEHVFLLSVHDDIWGKKSRSDSNKIGLPANLSYIRYMGSSEDELRRLLFVAVTRAKCGLYLTSYARKETGKSTEPVKYLHEATSEDGTRLASVLPEGMQTVNVDETTAESIFEDIELLWQQRHVSFEPKLKDLLSERLTHYYMSPTHLNSFVDLIYGGPQDFLLKTILRFPGAPTVDGEFGNAIHQTLEWYTLQENQPSIEDVLNRYSTNLKRYYIPEDQFDDINARGRKALQSFLNARKEMFTKESLSEVDFRKEGVVLGDARLTGKIDRLEIDKKSKTIRIVDYKTGSSYDSWKSDPKLHKYKQQLYFYKYLLEKSHSYQNYTVIDARLEFIEPNSNGTVAPGLVLQFKDAEYDQVKRLIEAVWNKIMNLDMPDTSSYSSDLSGIRSFENDLRT